MENYEDRSSPVKYVHLGDELVRHIDSTGTREVRFKKLGHPAKHLYQASVLRHGRSPEKLRDVDFQGAHGQRGIEWALRSFNRNRLPAEIRVIRTKKDSRTWGVFY